LRIDQEVVFAAGFAAIGRVGTCFFPP
jgi:hypothetical protein